MLGLGQLEIEKVSYLFAQVLWQLGSPHKLVDTLRKGCRFVRYTRAACKNDYLELTNILSLTAFDCASKLDMIVDIEDTM